MMNRYRHEYETDSVVDLHPKEDNVKTTIHSGESIPKDVEFPVEYIHDDMSVSLCFNWMQLRTAVSYDSQLVLIPGTLFMFGAISSLGIMWLLDLL